MRYAQRAMRKAGSMWRAAWRSKDVIMMRYDAGAMPVGARLRHYARVDDAATFDIDASVTRRHYFVPPRCLPSMLCHATRATLSLSPLRRCYNRYTLMPRLRAADAFAMSPMPPPLTIYDERRHDTRCLRYGARACRSQNIEREQVRIRRSSCLSLPLDFAATPMLRCLRCRRFGCRYAEA